MGRASLLQLSIGTARKNPRAVCAKTIPMGKYIWCMFDFASNGRQEGDTKGQNDKGHVTRERIPKDSFYFYKSVWNDNPMLHLTEKGFKRRGNVVPQVKAYSNAESVELFVNGVSCGNVKRSELDASFSTVFVWENIEIDIDKEKRDRSESLSFRRNGS